MKKTGKYIKRTGCFLVCVLLLVLQVNLVGLAQEDDGQPLLYYGGEPVSDGMSIPQSELLTAEFTVRGVWGELAGTRTQLSIPQYLLPALEEEQTVTGLDELGNSHEVGKLFLEDGRVWLTVQEPPGEPEPQQGGTTQPEPQQGGTTQPEPQRGGTTQPEPQQGGTTQPESQQGGTTQPEPQQGGTTQPEPQQGGTTQPESQQGGATQPESQQGGATQPQSEIETRQEGTTQPPPEGNAQYYLRPRGVKLSEDAGLPEASLKPLAERSLTIACRVPCQFDLYSIPVGEDGVRSVALQSGGQGVTLTLLQAPVLRSGFGPFSLDLSAVATDLNGSLKKDDTTLTDGGVISVNDLLTLRYDFAVTGTDFTDLKAEIDASTETPKQSAAYNIPLPANIALKGAGSGSIDIQAEISGTDYQCGVLNWDYGAGTASVVFQGDFWGFDLISSLDNAHVELGCGLDGVPFPGGPEAVQIDFAGGNTLSLKVAENQPTDYTLEKTVTFNEYTRRLKWTLTLTPGTELLSDPVLLRDQLGPAQRYVAGSMKLNENPYTPTEEAEGLLKMPIADQPTSPQVFTYETVLADEFVNTAGDTEVTNEAYVEDAEGNKERTATADYTLSGDDKCFITKVGKPSANNRTINWTVTLYTNDRNLKDLVLYDLLDDGLTLDNGQIAVAPPDGTTWTLSAAPGGSETHGTTGIIFHNKPSDGSCSFKVDFSAVSALPAFYKITYTTEVDNDYYDGAYVSGEFSNKAWLDFNWYEYGGTAPVDHTWSPPEVVEEVEVDTSLIRKTGIYDPVTHKITWTVTVNPYEANITSGTITDELAEGQEFVSSTLTLGTAQGELTLVSTDNGRIVVNVGALGTESHSFEIVTEVTDPDDFAFNNPAEGIPYTNTVSFEASVDSGPLVTNTATATVPVISTMLEKSPGSYNYADNTLTWEVTVNKNEMSTVNPDLVDTLPQGVDYVSFVLDNGHTNDYHGAQTDQDLLISTTGVSTSEEFTCTITTKVDPDKIDAFASQTAVELTNQVALKRSYYDDLTGVEATAVIPNQVLDKSAIRSGDCIKYSVNINPNRLTLPAGLRVEDPLPDGLTLKPDGVALYNATVSGTTSTEAGGTPTKPAFAKGTLVSGIDLKLSGAGDSFSVLLPPGRQAYILEYECYIDAPGSKTNRITFAGSTFVGDAAEGSVKVSTAGAAGGASSRLGARATFTARDKSGNPLGGLSYRLMVNNGGSWSELLQATTGADGKISFVVEPGREYKLNAADLQGYRNPMLENSPLNNFTFTAVAGRIIEKTIALENPDTGPIKPEPPENRDSDDGDSGSSSGGAGGAGDPGRVNWDNVYAWVNGVGSGSSSIQMGPFDLVPARVLEGIRGRDVTLHFTDGQRQVAVNGMDMPQLPGQLVYAFEELYTLFDPAVPTGEYTYNPNTGA